MAPTTPPPPYAHTECGLQGCPGYAHFEISSFVLSALALVNIGFVAWHSVAPVRILLKPASSYERRHRRMSSSLREGLLSSDDATDNTDTSVEALREIQLFRATARLFCLWHPQKMSRAASRAHKLAFLIMLALLPPGRILYSLCPAFNYAADDWADEHEVSEISFEATGCFIPVLLFIAMWTVPTPRTLDVHGARDDGAVDAASQGGGRGQAQSRGGRFARWGEERTVIDLDSLGIVSFLSKDDENRLEQSAGAKRNIFLRSISKWTRICHVLCVILALGVVGSYAYQISRALRAPFRGLPLLQVVLFGAVEGVQAFFAIGFLLVIMLHVRMMRKLIMVQLRESMRALLASRLFERAKTVPSFARHATHMTDDVLVPSEKFVSTFVWVFGLTLVMVTISVLFSVLSPLRCLGIGRYTYTSLFAVGVILAMFGNMFAQLDEILFRVRAPFGDVRVIEELRETVRSIRSVSSATAAVGAAVGLTRAGGGGTGQQVLKLGAKLVATTDVAAISQRAAQDVMEELGDGTKRGAAATAAVAVRHASRAGREAVASVRATGQERLGAMVLELDRLLDATSDARVQDVPQLRSARRLLAAARTLGAHAQQQMSAESPAPALPSLADAKIEVLLAQAKKYDRYFGGDDAKIGALRAQVEALRAGQLSASQFAHELQQGASKEAIEGLLPLVATLLPAEDASRLRAACSNMLGATAAAAGDALRPQLLAASEGMTEALVPLLQDACRSLRVAAGAAIDAHDHRTVTQPQ